MLFIVSSVFSQSTELANYIKTLFPDSKNINYIYLYGYYDDESEIQFYLAYNESEWKGICYYPSSTTRIQLEGGIMRNNLILTEFDNTGLTIGMWSLDINNDNLPAIWKDPKSGRSFTIYLKKLDTNKTEIKLRNTDIYEARINSQPYRIQINQSGQGRYYASIYNLGDLNQVNNMTECVDSSCNEIKINFQTQNNIEYIKVNTHSDKDIEGEIAFSDSTKANITLYKIISYPTHSKELLTKYYSIYLKYPTTQNPDKFFAINHKLDNIVDSLRADLEKFIKNQDSDNLRFRYHVTSTFEVGMINDNFYSGILTLQNNYNDKVKIYTLNYDLNTQSKIDMVSEFNDDFDFKKNVNDILKIKISENPYYHTSLMINYIKPDLFHNLLFTDFGMVLCSDFNTLFGMHRIVLPYDKFRGELKRKSILKSIF